MVCGIIHACMTDAMSYTPKFSDEVIVIIYECRTTPPLRCILPSLRVNVKVKSSNVLQEHYRLLPIHLEQESLETFTAC